MFFLILLVTSTSFVFQNVASEHLKPDVVKSLNYEKQDRLEFNQFCALSAKQRKKSIDPVIDNCYAHDSEFDSTDLKQIFTLILIILYGAIVRTVISVLKLTMPYTVVLMVSGLLIGFISKYYCKEMYEYTALARMNPKIILFTFLPILIFESAFSIPVHVFFRSISQILLLAVFGMGFSTFLTAMVCLQFFVDYKWTFVSAALFGSIISATDPVAVVAILRELGVAETLSVMIEGESLLNDGVAILLFEIFNEILSGEDENARILNTLLRSLLSFVRIAIGGPCFGFICGKIAISCLSYVFNDATVEVTITLCAAFLTYFIGEDFLGVSGVMAVVILGITMSAERTSISPDSESAVHHFWEMLGYLANTVLFVLVGIVITETALSNITWTDVWYLILLYLALNIIRFLMLFLMVPILSRLGYGLQWQSLVIMSWGGLRGAVGMSLALEVYQNPHHCDDVHLGPKMLFLTAGIVFLTLCVNGTTTKKLLDLLKLTEVSPSRIEQMSNAVRFMKGTQAVAMSMLRWDTFLKAASSTVIEKFTQIKNPYEERSVFNDSVTSLGSVWSISATSHDVMMRCPQCDAPIKREPSPAEYQELLEGDRVRILKALKISFWKQFEQGVLSEIAVHVLQGAVDSAADTDRRLVREKDFHKYLEIQGIYPWLSKQLTLSFGHQGLADTLIPQPSQNWRYPLWWLVTRDWFDAVILMVVLLNFIPIIWEFYYDLQRQCDTFTSFQIFFFSNVCFTAVYIAEFMIRMVAAGWKGYWNNKWNCIDFILLVSYIFDLGISARSNRLCKPGSSGPRHSEFFNYIKVFRLIRIMRILRLLRPMMPFFLAGITKKINEKLFLGYDVSKGFVTAVDDVLKFISQMIDNAKIANMLKRQLEKERAVTIREMGLIQRDNPGIAIGVKTRHASRAVLNQMVLTLRDYKDEGLIDDKEFELLILALEEKTKRLWNSPSSITASNPESLLANINWVSGNPELTAFIRNRARLLTFNFGEVITTKGDQPDGIYLIVAGLVKVQFMPTEKIVKELKKYGNLPNSEIMLDLTFELQENDFFSTGFIIGEVGVLTEKNRDATVTCETGVICYHISQADMRTALSQFNDANNSLEARIWQTIGMARAAALLPTEPKYQAGDWSEDKIRIYLQRSAVPIFQDFTTIFHVPDYVSDVIVIQGYVEDKFTGEVFIAPVLLPPSCTTLINIENPVTVNRFLVVAPKYRMNDDLQSSHISSPGANVS